MNIHRNAIKRLLIYWTSSFMLAVAVYGLLWFVMPHHHVFASLFRMFPYHKQHPLQYIAIPCFFFGPLAVLVSDAFYKAGRRKRIGLTLAVIGGTLACSVPFGGMLWYYHDFQAGYFPDNWFQRMADGGLARSMEAWVVVLLSIPYNLIGGVIAYFMLKNVSARYRN